MLILANVEPFNISLLIAVINVWSLAKTTYSICFTCPSALAFSLSAIECVQVCLHAISYAYRFKFSDMGPFHVDESLSKVHKGPTQSGNASVTTALASPACWKR